MVYKKWLCKNTSSYTDASYSEPEVYIAVEKDAEHSYLVSDLEPVHLLNTEPVYFLIDMFRGCLAPPQTLIGRPHNVKNILFIEAENITFYYFSA